MERGEIENVPDIESLGRTANAPIGDETDLPF
jgi:hypothetical protein